MWPWSRNLGKLQKHTYGNEKPIINRAYCPVIQLELCWLQGKYWTNTWNGRNFCPLFPSLDAFKIILMMHVFFLLLKKCGFKSLIWIIFFILLIYNNVFYFLITVQSDRFPCNIFLHSFCWILPCSLLFPPSPCPTPHCTLEPTPVFPFPLPHMICLLVCIINI